MPFDESRTFAPLTGGYVGVGRHDTPDPGWLEIVAAGFRGSNNPISWLASAKTGVDLDRVQPGYDVFADVKREGLERHTERFETVYSPEAFRAVVADIRRAEQDDATLAASGWKGYVASFAGSMLDPTILLPGGALYRSGKLGYRALRSGVSVAAAGAAGAGLQEAGLQATQELRSPEESMWNVGGTAILGGLIGTAAAKYFTVGEWTAFGKALKEELDEPAIPNADELVETIVARAQAAGAQSVDEIKLDDLGVGGPRLAQAVAKATAAARINPGVTTMLSPSKAVRETYARMIDNPVYSRMQMEGRTLGADAENAVKFFQGGLARWLRTSRTLYREAKANGYRGTRSDFYDDISRAGRRGDVDPNGSLEVTKAAQEARTAIYNPLLKEAQARGLLPDDVKVETAISYVSRLWNRERLIAEEERFRRIASEYFRREIAKIPEEHRPDFVSQADLENYIHEVVNGVFDNLTGKGKGDVPDWIVPAKRGPLQERTFGIADELVEDFLQNNSELILRRYTRLMGAEVELAKRFGRPDMRDQFDAIRNDYREMRAADPANAAYLDKAERRDLVNLEAFREMLRGMYRRAEEGTNWARATRLAMAWQFVTSMGGLIKASLTDPARLIAVHGMRATMAEGIPSLVGGLRSAKIARQDARDLGVVAETVLHSRLATISDIADPFATGSKLERLIANASQIFARATGISYWNDTWRTISATLTQNRILRNAVSYSSLDARERAYLAYLGIDDQMAEAIAKQFAEFGLEERGIRGANVFDWSDDLARRAFAAALAKDTDRTIINRGVADVPLFTHTNTGKLITQFKRFGLASHQRILIAGLQERPHRLAEYAVGATALGMLTSWLSLMEVGRTDDAAALLDNPGKWIADGYDRTGITWLITEPWNTVDKITTSWGGANIGMRRLAGALAGDADTGGVSTRYASRNATGALMGPSAGTLEDWAKIIAALSKGEMTRDAVTAGIKQVPGGTLPGIRSAIQYGLKPQLLEAVE